METFISPGGTPTSDSPKCCKYQTMIKNSILVLIISVFLAACVQRPSEKLELNAEDLNVGELKISSETVNQILQNIASPVEVAELLHSLNVPYSNSYLADAESLSARSVDSPGSGHFSPFEMAFSLGVLFADLGYLNVYEKTGSELDHLSSINELAEALDIGQFYALSIMKRLASSGSDSSDQDSLLFESIISFNNMENHLRNSGRSELSTLMITGVWLESLYLATQVASQTASQMASGNENEDLRLMIGEQKLILNDLLLILGNFKNEPAIQDYIYELEDLKRIYDQVKITYEVSAPQIIDMDDNLMLVQSEASHVDMSDEVLLEIIDAVREVRDLYVNVE